MLILKTDPVGIDVPIHQLQSLLHNKLVQQWNVPNEKYKAYSRCYRNNDGDNGYIAENYEGDGEYKEVYWDDALSVVCFFGIGSSIRHDYVKELASVHLIFFVDLAKVKPAILHRADEEARKDVLNAIGPGRFGFDYSGYELGIENVLRDYPGSRRNNRLKAVDMQTVHCFRLNFKLLYSINNCL
jgi:hypothetical protein